MFKNYQGGKPVGIKEGEDADKQQSIRAIYVNRNLKTVSKHLDKSVEKLSTGRRINRAGDDATNLAVSEKR